jgi:hypothetical protein
MATSRKLLGIYLNDHRLGATVALELVKRAESENEGTEFGEFLADLHEAIETDRSTLEDLMEALGVGKDPLKHAAAWAGEKVGRLKLNGQLRGYSPLSRLTELETLSLGVEGKVALWRALREIAPTEPALAGSDYEALLKSAQSQRRRLERYRVRAAKLAFAR